MATGEIDPVSRVDLEKQISLRFELDDQIRQALDIAEKVSDVDRTRARSMDVVKRLLELSVDRETLSHFIDRSRFTRWSWIQLKSMSLLENKLPNWFRALIVSIPYRTVIKHASIAPNRPKNCADC